MLLNLKVMVELQMIWSTKDPNEIFIILCLLNNLIQILPLQLFVSILWHCI